MDLDNQINRKRTEVLERMNLDVDWSDETINIYDIYSDIREEAPHLKTEGIIQKGIPAEEAIKVQEVSGFKIRLKKLDESLQKYKIYNLFIRKLAKKIYRKRLLDPAIKVKQLLRFEDEAFVTVCYNNILLREPDPEGYGNCLHALRMQELTKLDIIFGLSNSEEGKNKPVNIEGYKVRYFLICLGRKIFQLPVLGRIFHYVFKLFRVNNTMYRLAIWNTNLNNHIKQLDSRGQTAEQRLSMIIKEQNSQCNALNETVQRLKAMVEEQNKQIEKLSADLYVMKQDEETSDANDPYYAIDYFDFENKFRGSREHVKEVQKIYLPYFTGKKNVIDIGCGRGEFVELLKENQVGIKGVDLYSPYVEFCNSLDLPVVCDDGLHYLEHQEKVDGVFAGQVVEHMTLEQVIKLCRVAYEKLEEGSYLIMETPNPTSLGMFMGPFYLDPSHNKPMHPLTLKYIVEKAGFLFVEILFTESSRVPYNIPRLSQNKGDEFVEFDNAMNQVAEILYGSRDYAVIARK